MYAESNSTMPLIVYGDSGCGKTSLIAKMVNELASKNNTILVRFLGTTEMSSNIIYCYRSLLCQLEYLLQVQQSDKTFSNLIEIKNNLVEKIIKYSQEFQNTD